MTEPVDVLVIGAGVAGLTCARQLQRSRLRVAILEKSRGLGGRLATRRITTPHSTISVDHGCQYLTADTDSFHRFLKEQISQGMAVEWTRTLHVLDSQGLHLDHLDDHRPRYIYPEGMTTLAKSLAQGLTVHFQAEVNTITPLENLWQVATLDGRCWQAHSLVVAVPSPQLLPLMSPWMDDYPAFASLIQSAIYRPCLVVMAGYTPIATPLAWKGIYCVDDPYLSWVSLDSSKRTPDSDPVVVLHSTADFAEQYLEASPEGLQSAGQIMLKQASQRLGAWLAKPLWHQVHRWRYALAVETVGLTSLSTHIPTSTSNLPLVCAGDWCGGSRVEGAWLSGQDAATQMKSLLEKK